MSHVGSNGSGGGDIASEATVSTTQTAKVELFNSSLNTNTIGTFDNGVTWQEVADTYESLQVSLRTTTGVLYGGEVAIEDLQDNDILSVGLNASTHIGLGSGANRLDFSNGDFHFQTVSNLINAENLIIWGLLPVVETESFEAHGIVDNEEVVEFEDIEYRFSLDARQAQFRAVTGTIPIRAMHSLEQGGATENDGIYTDTLDQTWRNLDLTGETFSVAGAQERLHFERTDDGRSYIVDTRLGSGFNGNSIIVRRLGFEAGVVSGGSSTPLNRESVLDASLITSPTNTLEVNETSPESGNIGVIDGTITRIGTRATFEFELYSFEDDPADLDFSALMPNGGRIISLRATSDTGAETPQDDISYTVPDLLDTDASTIRFDRSNTINDINYARLSFVVDGYPLLEENKVIGSGEVPVNELRQYKSTDITGSVIDFTSSDTAKITLTENATVSIINPPVDVGMFHIITTQDEVGGHQINFPANVFGDTVLDALPDTTVILSFFFDGTDYHA